MSDHIPIPPDESAIPSGPYEREAGVRRDAERIHERARRDRQRSTMTRANGGGR
jgi:hypothetical protein